MQIKDQFKYNPWWENCEEINNDFHIKRLKDSIINWKPVIIENFDRGIYSLRGPRQIGKTTWIKLTISKLLKEKDKKDIMFFSCDLLDSKNAILELIEIYLDWNDGKAHKYIFLDEISYVKDWQIAVKHLYDRGLLDNTTLFVTGSHSIDIKKNIEKLPGRIGKGKRHYYMFPLSFPEFLEAKDSSFAKLIKTKDPIKNSKLYINEINKEFLTFLLTGGFPYVINDFLKGGKIEESTYEIYSSWIIGDLEKWGKKEKSSKQIMRRIFDVYTTQVGWSSLKDNTDIDSHSTIMDYVKTFEDLFCVEYINKLDWNKQIPDIPKNKKIYFSDPFLFYAVWKWCYGEVDNFSFFQSRLRDNIFQSKMIEGVVLNHIIKKLHQKNMSNLFDHKDHVFFWNNKSRTKEIDYYIKELGALEVKWQNQLRSKDLKIRDDFEKLFILSKSTYGKKILPVGVFLMMIEKWGQEWIL